MTSRARLSRRTAIASALLGCAGVAACDAQAPSLEPQVDPSVMPQDQDAQVLNSVVVDLARAEAVLTAAIAAAPKLRGRLTGVVTAHAAHRELLDPADRRTSEPAPPATTIIGGAKAGLRAVRASERNLQRVALRACTDSASGDLARVLASVAASSAQHVAALGGRR